jgi:NADPH-dependent ferric siderophore reductase
VRLRVGSLVRVSFSPATVLETVTLSSRLRRIVLQVDEPDELGVAPGADSAVAVYFSGAPSGVGRNYSVRFHDGARITVDVVLHAHGPGTEWASTAVAGDRVGLDHARSWYQPEATTEWQVLVSDLSGLPAAARIVEALPAGRTATLIVEVAAIEDLDYLPHRPDVDVRAAVGTGNGDAPSALADALRRFAFPVGRGYCWFAGEAAEGRAVRKHLRGLGWTIDQYDITGYWRQDSEAWDRRFERVQNDVFAVYQRALSAGKGTKEALEEFDEACERAGL